MRKSIKRFVSSVLAASMVLTSGIVGNFTFATAAEQTEGIPFTVDASEVVYNLDQAYTGEVTVDINFDIVGAIGGSGSLMRLRSSDGMDHEAAIRVTSGTTGATDLGKSASGISAGTVVVGNNTLSMTLNTATGEIKSVLNGVESTRTNDASYLGKDVAAIKFGQKAGRQIVVNSINVTTTGGSEETTTDATTETPTEATTAEATTAEATTEVTTVETTEATTAEVTEATTEAPVAPADNQVAITPEYSIEGDTLTVNYKAEVNNAGFNHYTMFLTFDPAVLTPVSAADGDITIAAKDATGADITVPASNAGNIEAQFADVPAADNTDFAGADGTLTQAQLGKVKVAYCIFDKSFDQAAAGALPEFTNGGTLFTVTYKINDAAALNGTVLGANVQVLDTVSSDLTVHGTAVAVVNETAVDTSSEPGSEITTEAPAESGYVYIPEKDAAADEEVYKGNGVTIVAVQNMKYTELSGTVDTVNGTDYSSYAQSTGVNTSLTTDPNEKAKSYRLAYKITADADKNVTIKVDHKVSSGKGNYILKDVNITGVAEDGTTPSGTATIVDSLINNESSSIYDTFTIELKAGETIWVAGQGTNICVYGIDAEVTGTVEPGEDTTEEVTETTTEFTPEEVTGVAIYGDVVNAASGSKATLTFKINENPGIANYLVFVTYKPADLMATGGTVANFDDGEYGADVINKQVIYPPTADDPDYAGLGADGTKTAAQLGKIKIAGISNANVTEEDATVFTMDFDVLATDNGVYPVSVEVVAVGNDSAQIVTCGSYPGYVVIQGGETPSESTTDGATEATTDGATEATTDGATEATTSQATTDADTETTTRRPSSGGGGGGSVHNYTTTTEATTEADTEDSTESPIIDMGNGTIIQIPTEKDPNFTGFTDLGNYPWAEDSINKLAELGIVSGIGDGQYGPALPCRRADFAILINRTLGVSVTSMTKNFYDNEDQSKYYYNDVRVGYNAGILSGYGDNNYKPEQYCTREEMAVLVAKSFEWLGNDVTSTDLSVNNKYTDVDNISWWSAPYVAYLTDMGILNGNTDGTLLPQNYINRAEMAVMMSKVYDYALDLVQSMTTTTEATTEETTVDSTEETTVDESSTETTTEEATETTTVVDEDL